MTIKEFAQLCSCNTQTLRYYDKIDLLKPAKVDPWSGYRYYDSQQAIDFVKIKNLQTADFSIEQIKKLLTLSDQQVYEAFDAKIAEQAQKLEQIRQIQKTYLAEKNTMEKIISSMTDYLLSQSSHPEFLTEFGLTDADFPAITACLKTYMNNMADKEIPQEEVSLTVNHEVVHGQAAVLERIHALTKEDLEDSILLNTGYGYTMEHDADSDPDYSDYLSVWERRGWNHVSDFIDEIPLLQSGKIYCLWLRTNSTTFPDDLSFCMFLLGAVLYRQKLKDVAVNCSVSAVEGKENHFKLLCKK